MSIDYGTGGGPEDRHEEGVVDHETAQPVAPAATRTESKPKAPRWVPAAVAIALFAGIGLGIVLGLVIGGGDEADAAASATTATTSATTVPVTTTTAAAGVTPGATSPAPDPTTTTSASATATTEPGTASAGEDLLAYGTVQITGDGLPRLPDDGTDLYLGVPVPSISGVTLDGTPIDIPMDDGRAKLVMFVAHWCPVCQSEVPVARDWLGVTTLPDNVDFYTVATLTTEERTNFPPGPWLVREQWAWPVLVDDESSSAASAVGLHAVPFWLLVNTDGTLAARGAGALPPEALSNIVEQLSLGPIDPTSG